MMMQTQTTFLKPFGMHWPWRGESITILHDGDGQITARTPDRKVIVDGRWDGKVLVPAQRLNRYGERGFVDDLSALLLALETYEEQGR